MILHPERYSTTGVVVRKAGVVVHDAESGDGAYANLLRFLGLPGDRIIAGSDPPRRYGSGYHAITDGAGGYTEVAPATAGPYHAPPLNKTWWGICMPGYANQTPDQWVDPLSRAHIRGVARFIVDKHRIDGFPLVRRRAIELRANLGGITAHADVSQAWAQTNHTDPGTNFPWSILLADVATLIAPTPTPTPVPPIPWENEMTNRLIRVTDDAAVLIVDGTSCSWAVSGPIIDDLIAAGLLAPKVGGALPIAVVPRRALKALHYVGPLPDYTGTPASLPGRTTLADFAS